MTTCSPSSSRVLVTAGMIAYPPNRADHSRLGLTLRGG
jgi:hypothetical protein